MKEMKMRIHNQDHSKAVQQWLFMQGYSWYHRMDQIRKDVPIHVTAPYLFVDSDGMITYSEMSSTFISCEDEMADVSSLDPHYDDSTDTHISEIYNLMAERKKIDEMIYELESKFQNITSG